MLLELVAEFLPAARVLVLKLHARWPKRVSLGRLRHAGFLERARRGLGLVCELLAFFGSGPVAAARDYQGASALRIGKAKMERSEAAHRKPDNMRLVELESVEDGADVVARAVLRITLGFRHVRRRIAARII